ncbi:hypothetical protein [Acinetobacter pittii]|uniref:hypothetical protein n=1 Tax=Acinetobacter pittii TaxID=48296 RepID=UPI00083FCE7B|nr:hypothetical protein [Acinetobacter pittii]ODL95728.1 hypothetical protein AXH21_09635 [Acinetobacter pittii]
MDTNKTNTKLAKVKAGINITGSDNMELAQKKFDEFFLTLSMLNFDEITQGRYSVNFIIGLLNMFMHDIDIIRIINEIRHLEDPQNIDSYTKGATQFSHLPLKGLWHKHYLPGDIGSICQNIINGLNSKGGLKKVISTTCEDSGEEFFTPDLLSKLVNEVTEVPFSERSDQKMITGEWIIYHVHENKNYYLAVECHSKGSDENDLNTDQKIAEKIRLISKLEFPQFSGSLEIFN